MGGLAGGVKDGDGVEDASHHGNSRLLLSRRVSNFCRLKGEKDMFTGRPVNVMLGRNSDFGSTSLTKACFPELRVTRPTRICTRGMLHAKRVGKRLRWADKEM